MQRRHIHRHHQLAQPQRAPGACRLTRLLHHQITNHSDQPAAFGNRNKPRRRYQPPFGVFPAQQGFGTDDASAAQFDLRLEVQLQLILRNRQTQARGNLQVLHRAASHLWVKAQEGVAAGFFGAVHRHVGMLEQGAGIAAIVRCNRNTHRCGDRYIQPIQRERLLQGLKNARHQRVHRVLRLYTPQQDEELIARGARHHAGLAYANAKCIRDLAQQHIARGMPQRIIDGFEVIQIQQQHRHLVGCVGIGCQQAAQMLLGRHPVG